jgi:hypothetical protein
MKVLEQLVVKLAAVKLARGAQCRHGLRQLNQSPELQNMADQLVIAVIQRLFRSRSVSNQYQTFLQ